MDMRLHIVILNLSIGPFMTIFKIIKWSKKKIAYTAFPQTDASKNTFFMEKYTSKHV
jgi:hypothetical protein